MAERILLVDDEEGIRKVLGLSLRDAGHTVFTAGSGEEALAIFARERPSIVLTDIKMPGMDGIGVLERVKALDPDAEVIMITGHGDLDLAIASIKRQAADFVTKPINEDVLDIALARAAEHISLRRQIREHTQNLERLVEEKTRELMAAERFATVGRTAAGLSHAIKNIASGLEGAIFMIEKGGELSEREYLDQGWDMLKDSVRRIKHLSLDLLKLSGRTMLCIGPHDPNRVAREVVDLMLPRAKEAGVELLLCEAAPCTPCLFDLDAMHQALLNLVTNALDACCELEEGPRRAEVSTARLDDMLLWRVTDSGPGMSGAVRERIFSELFSTKGGKGTGLGLLTAKKTAEAHGGRIMAESPAGGGAAFTLLIPAREASADVAGA